MKLFYRVLTKKARIVLICTIFSLLSFECNKEKANDEYVYEAVNHIIKEMEGESWIMDGSPSYNYLLDRPTNSFSEIYNINELFENEIIKKEFNEIDKKEFIKQQESYSNFEYKQDNILQKKIIVFSDLEKLFKNRSSFWENYKQKYGSSGYYDISFPLFSYDKEKLLVVIQYCGFEADCHGQVCLFEKKIRQMEIEGSFTLFNLKW